ncbi:hypothetical protein [Flagellimonas abyssi]|uniref:Transposase DDE domain-containing protein n=1 Tax=Flagellimonas abyssi TaxID=2864871 RepID=A0ABS7EWI3_9FLAO|nr:hypothetical protein [Allomuricauda abyssi]MBW8201112.1 hypothetical protein [Allomuricauda abyssi]
MELNKGPWNGDKRLKHGQFSSDNEECKKAHNTVYEIIAPIRALRFIYLTLGRILKASGLNQVATLLRNSRPLGIRPNAPLNQIASAVGTRNLRPNWMSRAN